MGNDSFDANDLKDWMRALIETKKQEVILKNFNSQIGTVPCSSYIHLYHGIDIIADILEVELIESVTGDSCCYPFKYSFIFEGMEFMQLEHERIGKYAGKD